MKTHCRPRVRFLAPSLAALSLSSLSLLAAPPTDIVSTPTQPVFAPSAGAGTLIATFSSTDADVADTHTYSLVNGFELTPLLPQQSTWNFFESDPGNGWQNPGFDDTGWSTGSGDFGYGNGDENTAITNTVLTAYFRTTFNIADTGLIGSLRVGMRADDGAVVYINGVEAVRQNVSADPVTDATFADGTIGGDDEYTYFETTITDLAPLNLVNGANTIAVSVHQGNATSSDLLFDLELVGASKTNPLDNGLFTLFGNQLYSTGANTQFEGETRTVRVRSLDSGSEEYEEEFTILTTANTAPVASDATFAVDEGSLVHTVVGTISATDTDNFTYAITGGNTGNAFAIHPETGELKVDRYLADQIDFETTPVYDLTISITDDNATNPLTTEVIATVNINDIDESPVFGATVPVTVETLAPVDTAVATALATDPELIAVTHTITSGNTGNAFKIDAATGEISVNTPAALNPALNPSFDLEITADDGTSAVSTVVQHIDVANVLVALDATASYLVPSSGADDLTWFNIGFDDSSWLTGASGFGYDAPAADPSYNTLFTTDVSSVMEDINASIYIRYEFNVADANDIGGLFLNANYEDGFVAYLNGVEVASRTAPALLAWNSGATGTRNEPDVFNLETIDLSAFIDALVNGTNVLAVHGLNAGAGSSDFVFRGELTSIQNGSVNSPVAPVIGVAAAEAVTQTSARFPVTVSSTGGTAPTVTLYYGETDGGEVPGNWDNTLILGNLGIGTYEPVVTNLAIGGTYFYAVSATNTAGTSWAAGTEFQTQAPAISFPSFLVDEFAFINYRVPVDASEDSTWYLTAFDDSAWQSDQQAVGYEAGTGYEAYIIADVQDQMENRETSVYVRTEFSAFTTDFDRLRLLARYDDAFVAYLNGVEILRVGAPEGPLGFETFTETGHEAGDAFESFDVTTAALPLLSDTSTNVLAVHGINQTLGSSDMILQFQLVGDDYDLGGNFTPPTVQTLAPSAITPNGATANGAINDLGGSTGAQVVLFYGTSDGGTDPVQWENQIEIPDPQTGAFTQVLNGLNPATNYFYNLYAYNEAGLTWATTQSFTTTGTVLPEITTEAELAIDGDTYDLNGNLVSIGGDAATQVIVAWGATDAGGILGSWDNQLNLGVLPVGPVAYTLDNIEPNSTVFYRYFATNSAGTAAATSSVSFTTPILLPVLDLVAASGITTTGATLSGTLAEDGGDAPVVTFHYGTSDGGTDDLVWQNSVSLGATSEGPVSTNLTGLTPSQQYFFRASATNSQGTAWSPVSRMFFAGQIVILDQGATASYFIPVDAAVDGTWYTTAFDDSAWATGPTGIGYDEDVTYIPLIGIDVEAELNDIGTSAYIRIDFNVANTALIQGLVLNMKHDDGMVAYLNGTEVTRDNVTGAAPLPFDSTADGARDDVLLEEFEAFDISSAIGQLVNGNNVLAIHGLNTSGTSSDFVMLPQIVTLADPIPAADDYASWVAGYPSLTGANALATADPDRDGIINLLEYAFGGDPTVPGGIASGAPILPEPAVASDIGGDFFEITYRRRIDFAARNIAYGVELSADMMNGTWTPSVNFTQQGAATPAGDGVTEFVTLRSNSPIGPDQVYGRISVTAN